MYIDIIIGSVPVYHSTLDIDIPMYHVTKVYYVSCDHSVLLSSCDHSVLLFLWYHHVTTVYCYSYM